MPGNGHVRFGRRAAETDRQKRRHRAAARPHNLVCDPAVLVVAWARVRGNRGKRTAGSTGFGHSRSVSAEEGFLPDLREDLKARQFAPLPVRERMIPKARQREAATAGHPDRADRIVQAALKLVLEPIFEADFKPCSYGFRPRRRAHDAIAEIHQFATHSYEWVLEADIEACFDNIASRPAGPGADAGQGQTGPGAGEGVPEGRDLDRTRREAGHPHRHTPGRECDRLPPCGVPADESRSPVSVLKIPALRNALINATTRRSEIRRRTRSSSALWLISSKQAAMSPSNAHS